MLWCSSRNLFQLTLELMLLRCTAGIGLKKKWLRFIADGVVFIRAELSALATAIMTRVSGGCCLRLVLHYLSIWFTRMVRHDVFFLPPSKCPTCGSSADCTSYAGFIFAAEGLPWKAVKTSRLRGGLGDQC
ncbi:hypothetical protein L210DRAFT_3526869 [Boletus edulis BED1]|uniref:Uncharacterized protein n=1 Tax=Boletus edulis BED1 TaxID=1328754 RepID=A0AAD4C428_BOLED|nr:hypothetical protein L210DRAFT_3526869 [Boletus edulis BED1]